MKKLLLDEHPLQVLPSLACAIGLNEAMMLQQIHYWLTKSKQNFDGRQWVYKTLAEWKLEFPFFSAKTVQRTIENLENCSLIISTKQYNENHSNQTKWYTIDQEIVDMLEEADIDISDLVKMTKWAFSQNDQMQLDKMTKPDGQNDQLLNKVVTETTTETTTETPIGAEAPRPSLKDHPAIQVYCVMTDRYPNKIWWNDIAEAVTDNPDSLEKWGGIIKDWLGYGWNKVNVKGMLDAFKNGGIASRQNGKPANQPTGWTEEQRQADLANWEPPTESAVDIPPLSTIVADRHLEIWTRAFVQLRDSMSVMWKDAFDTWLREAEYVSCENDLYTLALPSDTACTWVNTRFKKTIVRTLSMVAGQAVDVKFVVRSAA